jgi:hypothetical protein
MMRKLEYFQDETPGGLNVHEKILTKVATDQDDAPAR